MTTSYDTFLLVLTKKGSLDKVSREIGKSIPYVSIMRKISRNATATLLNAWGDGGMPFDLVRLVIAEDAHTQMAIVREYVGIAYGNGKKAKGRARATLLARLVKS
jgi:hypothetical protein